MLTRRIGIAAAALLAAAALPATASADSIVYMKDGQVWVANPDNSAAHAVTKYAFNWHAPSEADDGTIVAAGGPGHGPYGDAGSDLYVFNGDGNLRNGPIPTPGTYYDLNCPTIAPPHVRVSPDASKIAYTTTICDSEFTALWTPSTATGLDWPRQNNGLGTEDFDMPGWVDSGQFVVSHVGDTLTSSYARWWAHSTDNDTTVSEPAWSDDDAVDSGSNAPMNGTQAVVSRDATRFAIFENDQSDWIPPVVHNVDVRLYSLESDGSLTWRCTIPLSAPNTTAPFYLSPSFSPDGSKLLWGDDTGVEVMALGDVASGCSGHGQPALLVPGASEPFYAKGNLQPEAANPSQPGAPAAPSPPPTATASPSPAPSPSAGSSPTAFKPVASFKVTTKKAKLRKGLKIAFDAGKSSELGGRIVRYSWTFGDKAKGSGRKVTHRFRKAGTYRVTLTVVDAAGHKATRTLKVKIRR
jgi:hypothetical protein